MGKIYNSWILQHVGTSRNQKGYERLNFGLQYFQVSARFTNCKERRR